ncbi:recombinase family protein [Lentzea terrae]|uniref:recombinase family protein n=1 Tax=Lentzea terrae TaxID=2200761 RepID=UPI000DD2C58A|nr:recombinase family protein [Lentzea terrae]
MTVDISRDPWSKLDELLGIEVAAPVEDGIGPVAFCGRCSTEDNQDPRTSRAWQYGNAEKLIEPLGGVIVDEYFDVGQSRSVPWERRPEASRLLAALKDSNRGWSAIVVGEGTRCWFGNQFSLVAPKFAAYGVDLWVPELGAKYDSRNPSHKMLMSMLGGMSESERQHVQARVRAAMDAQVLNDGRHQGGRAPYGYNVVDGGPHPNPRKAAEGGRLRVLAIDEPSAEVVRRIFAQYLTGEMGDRAIANSLNRDGIPCPSARRPDQNRHRLADGWQGSTVRAILDNPRYTGFAFFGRWTRQEMLLDPDDVGAGHVVRFRRSAPDRVVRSRKQAHPHIVSVEEFVQSQLLRRSRAAGGFSAGKKLVRGSKRTKRVYPLRGRVKCGYCTRRMEGTPTGRKTYYRCALRTMVPGSPALNGHPTNVYLPEDAALDRINGWLDRLFAPENVDSTVSALAASQDEEKPGSGDQAAARKRLAEAEAKLRRFQDAIAAGVNPEALVGAINEAAEKRAAAEAELDGMPKRGGRRSVAAIYAMIDALGDVKSMTRRGEPDELQKLYEKLGLETVYNAEGRTLDASIRPDVRDKAGVREGT